MTLREALAIFGFSKLPSVSVFKKTYRKLAQQYHPDKGGTEEQMKALNLARDIIAEALTRSEPSEKFDWDAYFKEKGWHRRGAKTSKTTQEAPKQENKPQRPKAPKPPTDRDFEWIKVCGVCAGHGTIRLAQRFTVLKTDCLRCEGSGGTWRLRA